jgi:hypothetical protein
VVVAVGVWVFKYLVLLKNKLTIKNIIYFLITMAIVLFTKNYLFSFVEDLKDIHLIIVGFITFIVKALITSIFEFLDLTVLEIKTFPIKSIIKDEKEVINNVMNKNNGEGSSKDSGEGSSKEPNTGSYIPFNYGDFEWSDSDSASDKETSRDIKPLAVPPKSEIEVFEEFLQEASVEEVALKLNQFSEELEEYQNSGANVPAAKAQMEILQEKIEMCAAKISRDLEDIDEESTEDKGKGKEPEYEDKGKGKEPEYKNKGKGKERER